MCIPVPSLMLTCKPIPILFYRGICQKRKKKARLTRKKHSYLAFMTKMEILKVT